MNKKQIKQMAREAGIDSWWDSGNEQREILQDHLEHFAGMVAAAERERIAKKIEKLPFGDTSQSFAVWVRQDVP